MKRRRAKSSSSTMFSLRSCISLSPTAQQARSEETVRVSVDEVKNVRDSDPEQEKKPQSKKTLIGNIVFYGVLVIMVAAVFFTQMASGDGVKTFMGHSAFIEQTGSMESVYPKGSLILTRSVDAGTLEVGDDITYLANPTTTVTHRIIAIYENYESSGERGFKTQGVTNASPDEKVVPAVNIVGKVIFCSVFLGSAVAFASKNWPILLFAALILIALTMVLKFIFKSAPDEPKTETNVK